MGVTINKVNHVAMEASHVGVTGVAIQGIVGTMVGSARVAHGRAKVHMGVHGVEDKVEFAGIRYPSITTTVIVVLLLWYWGQRRV